MSARQKQATRRVALLRGINVGGSTSLPMAELRAACEALGWADVRTWIQSGNVVFRSEGPSGALEAALEGALAQRFGLEVPVLVRTASQWDAILRGNPFPAESEREASRVMLALSRDPPVRGALGALRERSAAGEQVELAGDVLWVYYPQGAGRSRLAPGFLDRAVGSPVTTRNWRTVTKLAELLEEA